MLKQLGKWPTSSMLLFTLVFLSCISSSLSARGCPYECVNGVCHDGICVCRYVWYGETCALSIFDGLRGLYIFLLSFYSSLFAALLLVTVLIVAHTIKSRAHYYHRIGFGLIAFDCVVQIVIYSVTPETKEGRGNLYAGGVLTMLHFSLIYITYCVYLVWWIELNARYRRMKKGMARASRHTATFSNASSVSNSSISISDSSRGDSEEQESPTVHITEEPTNISADEPTEPAPEPAKSSKEPAKSASEPAISRPDLAVMHANENSSTTLVKAEAGKVGVEHVVMEEKRGVGLDDYPKKTGIFKWWHKVAPNGVSSKVLKRILWTASIMVLVGNAVRLVVYEMDVPSWVGPLIYAFFSVVAWLLIMAGFDLYKRSFLRKLQLDQHHEVVENMKKVSYTTYAIVAVLLLWAILAFLQTVKQSRSLALTVYIVRGIVTAISICLYIHCFGSNAAKRIVILAKARFDAMYHK